MKWMRDNALTVALLVLFGVALAGQIFAGWRAENHELMLHGEPAQQLLAYVGGGAFLSSVFENWESEFLQMMAYVVLTAHLFQRGSAESRDPDAADKEAEADAKEEAALRRYAAGVRRFLHAHSLGLALGALFLVSFVLHWINSARAGAEEAMRHGDMPLALWRWLADPEFWFESFQNWQSEFLATGALVVLTIFLREKGSPESKRIGAPNSKTGKG